jgi:hypothetical protein
MSILFIKICVFILIINFTSVGGGDSDYYHSAALGEIDYYVNIWPEFLAYLNDIGLYNREIMKYLLFLFSSIIIPILVVTNIDNSYLKNKLIKWNFFIIISLYPVLFLFSLDIYRDIVMVFLFMISVSFIHLSIDSKQIILKLLFLILFVLLSYHLIFWRPYLGGGLLLTLFLYPIVKIKFFTYKKNIILYFLTLLLCYSLGLLDSILLYRGINGFEVGNNSIGIGLYGKNIIEFMVLYFYSILLQLFSMHFVNIGAILLFVLESLPFSIALYFIIKNRNYLTNFHKFLLLFFIIYGTVWLLGNDNLGTAMRLRVYNYLVVFMIAASIYVIKKNKKRLLQNGK